MFRNPIEKIHLCFAGIALALAGVMVSFDVWTAMALGTLLAAFNLHLSWIDPGLLDHCT